MKVYNDLNSLPEFRNTVLTIGSFDGVHLGHQKIIERVRSITREIQGESVLITFHPHPRQIVYPKDNSLQLLTTIEEKVQLLRQYGLDHTVVVPFTVEFSQQPADEYIQKFLVGNFKPRYIVIGYDHRFGSGRQGDINHLKWYASRENYEVVEIEPQEVDAITISSTKIRKALQEADVAQAARLLGHPFTLTGMVVRGQQIGNTIGFPTANLNITQAHKLIPPSGIYAVQVVHQEQRYDGMLYIGNRPTLSKYNNRTIEVNIFQFDKTIYGDKLQIELLEHLREDQKFKDLGALRDQLIQDRESALAFFKTLQPTEKKKDAPPRVAVVILNYNGRDWLERFLPALLESTYENFEVIIADNASTDTSVEFLQEHYPELSRIELSENYGFAEGYNQALKSVEGDYFILLNSDVEVTPSWLEPLIETMEQDQDVAACQPKICAFDKKDHFEYAGAAGGWIDRFGYPFCRGRIFAHCEADQGQYDTIQEVFWATGAALCIRADLFEKIGGFDPEYFAHAEEIDLCWRLKRAGYRIMVRPKSKVYHAGGGTLAYNTPRKTYLNFRNTLFNILKNEPALKVLWLVPFRILLDWLAGGLFLYQGRPEHLWAIIRAHWSFYFKIRAYIRKRRYYQELIDRMSIQPEPDKGGRYKGSIVWDYYVRQKKVFSKLSLK